VSATSLSPCACCLLDDGVSFDDDGLLFVVSGPTSFSTGLCSHARCARRMVHMLG
jgi:hypothetical protein